MSGGVGSGIASSYSLGHKVRLLPPRLPVGVPQVLVLPHTEQDLTGKLDHSAAVFGPLPGDVHQSVHSSRLQQGSEI